MKNFILKYRKSIVFIFMYIGLFRLGVELFYIFSNKNKIENYTDYAGLIASLLFCLACFWPLYISKRKFKF